FASLPIMQALATVKCGFELETQSVDGRNWDELAPEREPEFDDYAWDDYLSERRAEFWDSQYINRFLADLLQGNSGSWCCARPDMTSRAWLRGLAESLRFAHADVPVG